MTGLVEHRDGVEDMVTSGNERWEVVMLDVVDNCLTFLADKNVVLALHQTAEDGSRRVEGSVYTMLC